VHNVQNISLVLLPPVSSRQPYRWHLLYLMVSNHLKTPSMLRSASKALGFALYYIPCSPTCYGILIDLAVMAEEEI
jgi:hypothetical protein